MSVPLANYSAKDRNLIKSALRRAFTRSDIYRGVAAAARVPHYDPDSPRCLKYSKCAVCLKIEKTWKTEVDHLDPVVPVTKTLEQMDMDELVARVFCAKDRLRVLCHFCHDSATAAQKALRPKKPKKTPTKKLTSAK